MAPKIEFEKFTFEESRYKRGRNCWYATTLRRACQDQQCEVFDYPVAALDMSHNGFQLNHLDDFCWHMWRTLNADYSLPVILDDFGQVADGYHRLCHAIIDGKGTVPAMRLKKMPEADFVEPEDEENK